MSKLVTFLSNKHVEFWLTWSSRIITIFIAPLVVFGVAWFKSELVAHGNEHFVKRAEFAPVPVTLMEVSNRVAYIEFTRWKRDDQEKFIQETRTDRALVKQQLEVVAEALREIRGELKEMRRREGL